jgi:hypothetical protein
MENTEDILDAYAILQRYNEIFRERQQSSFTFAVLQDIQRRLQSDVRSFEKKKLLLILRKRNFELIYFLLFFFKKKASLKHC